jgi:stearoyl-CoA desaturase (delta-9 desaturase)
LLAPAYGARHTGVVAPARVIWMLEQLGWVGDVRWPVPSRLGAKRAVTLR